MDSDAQSQAAFVSEITRHQAALRGYIISLMPGISGTADVLQETNLTLWEKRDKFELGTNFRAWAFATARFKVKEYRRKMMRAGLPLLDEELAEQLGEMTDEAPEAVDDRLAALNKCLGRLSDTQRQLIEQRYFPKSNLDELAARCGRSVNSLQVTLCRIRAALKKCIQQEMNVTHHRP